jgi:hypothetical protein
MCMSILVTYGPPAHAAAHRRRPDRPSPTADRFRLVAEPSPTDIADLCRPPSILGWAMGHWYSLGSGIQRSSILGVASRGNAATNGLVVS